MVGDSGAAAVVSGKEGRVGRVLRMADGAQRVAGFLSDKAFDFATASTRLRPIQLRCSTPDDGMGKR